MSTPQCTARGISIGDALAVAACVLPCLAIEMVSDDRVRRPAPPKRPRKRCRHCKAAAVDPPLLTIGPRNLYEWFLCEDCWLLLEIGFSDARPSESLHEYLTPLDGRPSDGEIYRYVLRGRVLLKRLGKLAR
jgi:hypothetical protein